jgi:hypothetical protein
MRDASAPGERHRPSKNIADATLDAPASKHLPEKAVNAIGVEIQQRPKLLQLHVGDVPAVLEAAKSDIRGIGGAGRHHWSLNGIPKHFPQLADFPREKPPLAILALHDGFEAQTDRALRLLVREGQDPRLDRLLQPG